MPVVDQDVCSAAPELFTSTPRKAAHCREESNSHRSRGTSSGNLCRNPGSLSCGIRGKPGGTLNRTIEIIQSANILTFGPFLRARRRGRVPQMKAVRVSQHRDDATARPTEPKRNVIVLAAPTHKALVETIDGFEVSS